MGAAVSSAVCAETIVNQIASVGQMAINIATLGSSGAASSAAGAAKNAGKIAQLKGQLDKLKKAVLANKSIGKVA
jgi:hypothetical protein